MELHGEDGEQQACSLVNVIYAEFLTERCRSSPPAQPKCSLEVLWTRAAKGWYRVPPGSAVHWHNYLAYEARIGWDVSMADWNAEGTPVSLVAAQANAVFAEVNAISN